jgi:hypothetical protein
LIQVLGIGAAVAVPAIVGNVHEYVSTETGRLADFVGKDRLVADEDSNEFTAGIERRV